MLKYNGYILKVDSNSTLDIIPPPPRSVWDGTYDYSWYNTPSTSVPTAQGTAASSTSDLISRYNSANTVGKYTLKSDFTFQGNS